MATWEEISRDFANRIRRALEADGFTKAASLTEGSVKYSAVVRALRQIHADLDTYTVGDHPLTEDERKRLLVGAGREFGLADPNDFARTVKAASNDAYMELVDYIDKLRRK